MSAAWAIFKKELRVWFVSPIAYVFLGAFLFLAGLFFVMGIQQNGEASLRAMFSNLSVSLLFLLPLLTMKHFAEEERLGTFEFLMTAPVPLWALLLGKWAASLALCALLLLLTGVFPLLLAIYGDPDWGVIATSYLGLLLCCGAFSSAGLFTSSLSDEPVAAGLGGVLVLLPFWIAGGAAHLVDWEPGRQALRQLSFLTHVEPFSVGVIDSSHVAWFVLFSFAFLFLTWRSVESRRWR
ncbi:MAG: ABC transporter permease [Deltaproteobacteria bacterium]|jgi:ABC-2 type transport system permease protein|nr:ABC transporter permease [Deltaproteobacteria bacterium]